MKVEQNSLEFPPHEPIDLDFNDPSYFDVRDFSEDDVFKGFESPKEFDLFVNRIGQQIISLAHTDEVDKYYSLTEVRVGLPRDNKFKYRSVNFLYNQKFLTPFKFSNFRAKIDGINNNVLRYVKKNEENHPQRISFLFASDISINEDGDSETVGHAGVKLNMGIQNYGSPRIAIIGWRPFSLLMSESFENLFNEKIPTVF